MSVRVLDAPSTTPSEHTPRAAARPLTSPIRARARAALVTHPLPHAGSRARTPCPLLPHVSHPPTHPPPPSGTIPACLSNFTNLEWLWLQDNSLRGTIPESLCTIGPSLIYLTFNFNELTGA